MIQCTNCGHVNPEGASQCEACFDTLPALTSCPTCQTSVPDDAFFCPQCGASLPRGVSHQHVPASEGPDGLSLTAPPAFNDLPPTNVVAQQAFSALVSPTDVVSFAGNTDEPSDLPPTNVVHGFSPSDLPPTNVIHGFSPSDLPPTNVVNIPPPSDLPPTNADNPNPLPFVAETIPPQAPPISAPAPVAQDPIETIPTMVVSPGANRDVIDPSPVQKLPAQPLENPGMPPTIPPQSPMAYQSPPALEPPAPIGASPIDLPFTPGAPSPQEFLQNSLQPQEFVPGNPPPQPLVSASPPPPQDIDVPLATTVQPYAAEPISLAGETLIQLPSALLIHERTEARITLPKQSVILLGKLTETIEPDVDVLPFPDSDVVSRRHAAIFMEENNYFIEDLGSSNGTYVNEKPCPRGDRLPIQPGDRICLGREHKVSFIFQIG
jgi:pSer/pThr/pTyr-binding forkhead associated (FHA) protein